MKKILVLISLIFAFAVGIWVANVNWMPWQKKEIQEEATTLLERIDKVTKLVTVDGYFSEVYDYKDYYGYDWPIFRKKALIRVKAKVSAGYDLGSLDVQAVPDKKTILVRGLPKPEILSIDHDLDYYDLSEGTFNTFSNADLTKLGAQAKSYIEKSALESDLLEQAESQGLELLNMLEFMVSGAGWTLVIEEDRITPVSQKEEPSVLN